MTEQEKQLLLKDLCGRLPYKTKIEANICPRTLFPMDVVAENLPKPYLRPMSSMTDEEKKVYDEISHHLCSEITAKTMIHFLNAHHLDYNNWIEKGLALEAPEGMYETKTE